MKVIIIIIWNNDNNINNMCININEMNNNIIIINVLINVLMIMCVM